MTVLLAKKFDPSKHNVDGWMVSEKLDGMRAYWNGESLVTRSGKPINAPDWFTECLPADCELDGELFVGRGEFQATISVCRKKTPVDAEWKTITYMVFDIPSASGAFADRYKIMADRCNALPDHVEYVKHWTTETTAGVAPLLTKFERKGAEGLMLRDPASRYERKRSATLLKVKSFLDADATIVSHQPGSGKYEGSMGALLCVMDDGTEFAVGTGFSDWQRDNPPAVGEQVIFSYFELTKAGVPRFPAYIGVRGDTTDQVATA